MLIGMLVVKCVMDCSDLGILLMKVVFLMGSNLLICWKLIL